MGRGGTVLGIIGIILAAGAIGFGFVVWNGQNTSNSDLEDLTGELNNLQLDFNNLTDEFNDLESDYNNLTNTINNLTQTIVVGIWDELDDNSDFAPYNLPNNWLFAFGTNSLNNTDYISVSNTNTRITLLQSGWYRIQLSVLVSGISPSSTYWIRLRKDDAVVFWLDRYQTSATAPSIWHSIDSSAFVYSNGTNYIEINAYSVFDSFYCDTDDRFNQLTIEYVAI